MDSRKLSIAFACNSSFGLYNFRGELLRQLASQGHTIFVIAPSDRYTSRLEALGCKFVHWDISGQGTSVLGEMRTLLDLSKILKQAAPDICFNFTIKPVIYGALLARFLNLKVVSVVTGLGYVFVNRGLLNFIGRGLYKIALGGSEEIWFLNDEDRLLFSELGLLPKSRIKVLPGEGIDSNHFAPDLRGVRKDCRFRFSMISRVLIDKGVREYIGAASILRKEGVEATFELVGNLDESNPNHLPAEELGKAVAERVISYIGAVDDVRPIIAQADCVVLPSYREGVPRALLEAASMGKPLIATDVPGCRDVVLNEQNGFLCEPRSAESLAAAMQRIVSMDRDRVVEMGQSGRNLVTDRFDHRFVQAEYLETIERIVSSRQANDLMSPH